MFKGIPKMFGGPNHVISDDTNYASNSLEMQLRQLADIAFLLQSYDLAFQSYHQVKKDFQSTNAWLYYGGAVEMCAVTAYHISSTRRDVISYLEEAISVYDLSCKAPYYGTHASLTSSRREVCIWQSSTVVCSSTHTLKSQEYSQFDIHSRL